MKNVTAILIVCVLGAGRLLAADASYQATVLAQGPVGYWRLGEAAPVAELLPVAVNLGWLGSARNGTYRGDLTDRGALGAVSGNAAIELDGASQYVEVLGASAFGSPSFTAECWFAPNGPGGTTCIMSCGDFTTARRGWLIYQNTLGQVQLRTYNGVNNVSVGFNANTNLVVGQYYHLAVTRSNTTFRLYLNGVLMSQGIPAAPNTYAGPQPTDLFTVGIRATPLASPWWGKVDEVAYYTNALPPDVVRQHFQTAATNPAGYAALVLAQNPALYLRLDEPAVPSVANLGTGGGALAGRPVFPAVAGAVGPQAPAYPGFESTNTAFALTGSSNSLGTGGFIKIPPLNLNTNTVTITCWLKPNGDQAGLAGIVTHRTETVAPALGTTAGLVIRAAGGLALGYNWDGDDATYQWAGAVPLTGDAWNFAALVVQADQATVFVPGGANPNPAVHFHRHAPLEFEGYTYFGTDLAKSGFNGTIDEVAIFNRTLSLGEVYGQYGAAVGNLGPRVFTAPSLPGGTLFAGDPLMLSVDAGGSGGVAYQWRRNGSVISGATNSTFTIASLVAGGPWSYDLVLTNHYGSVTTAPVSLLVSPAITPVISKDLLPHRTLFVGGSIRFSVGAQGGGIAYQWQKDGANLTGQTTANLWIENLTTSDAGQYRVALSNVAGLALSTTCVVSIADPAAGSYEALVSADQPVSWWRLNEAPGAAQLLDSMGRADGLWSNNAALGAAGALANNSNAAAHFDASQQAWGEVPAPLPVTLGDFTFECWARTADGPTDDAVPFSSFRPRYGTYFRRASNGTWQSHMGYGDVEAGYSRQSLMGDAPKGQWTHLVVLHSHDTGTRTYLNGRWDRNAHLDFCRNRNVPIRIGALDPANEYGLRNFFTGDVDEVAVYDKALTEAQVLNHYLVARYGSNSPPHFAQQPQPQTVFLGQTATFTTLIEGSPAIGQRWFRNGQPVAGATTPSLVIANASYGDAVDRTYFCVATNGYGAVTSSVVTLTVLPPPAFANLTNKLVLHLKFDGNSADSSGRAHHATAVGGPQWVPGVVGSQAVRLSTVTDGPNGHGGNVVQASYLTLGAFAHGTDLSFSSNVSFSVAYWLQTPPGRTTGDLPLLCSASGSYGQHGITVAPSYDQGGWSWSLGDAWTFAGADGAPGSVNEGDWHHLAHAFDRATGQATTYLDGALVNVTRLSWLDNIDTYRPFNIGQDSSGSYAETATNHLDDLAVWKDRVLSAPEAYAMHFLGRSYGRSFDDVRPVVLQWFSQDGETYLVWQAGTLLKADELAGPWTPVSGAIAPYHKLTPPQPPTPGRKFYRVEL